MEKEVTLGQHDEEMFQYEIADGLTEEDLITYPEEGLKEGMATAKGENGQMGQSNPEPMGDGSLEGEMLPEGEALPEENMMENEVLPEEGMMSEEPLPEEQDGAEEIIGGTEDAE